MEATRFLDPNEPETGFLSNFYAARFTLDAQDWPTVEHYFQAQKFADTAQAEAIRQAKSPRAAKLLGQSRAHPLRPDWDTSKQRVMLRALVAKFVQNPELAQRLLASDGRLVEASPNDTYWGEGPDRLGANLLGRLLMAVRAELPEADHQNMLAHGDAASLQARCGESAWILTQDSEFKHNEWTWHLSVNVLTSPLYGHSCSQIAHRLQPLLGKDLAGISAWRAPGGDFKAGFLDGWRLHWRDPASPTLRFRPDTTLRLAHWWLHSVALDEGEPDNAPPGDTRDELKDSFWHTAWRLESVWALAGPDWDALLKYHYPPVAEAIALELERCAMLTTSRDMVRMAHPTICVDRSAPERGRDARAPPMWFCNNASAPNCVQRLKRNRQHSGDDKKCEEVTACNLA